MYIYTTHILALFSSDTHNYIDRHNAIDNANEHDGDSNDTHNNNHNDKHNGNVITSDNDLQYGDANDKRQWRSQW